MEASKESKEERKGNELQNQSPDQDIATSVGIGSRPVIWTGYSRATALHHEREDVKANENGCKSSTRHSEDAVSWRGKYVDDESTDE